MEVFLTPLSIAHTTKMGNFRDVKKTLASLILIAPLMLTACATNAPAELSKPQKLNKWIEDAGHECASWKEVSKTQSNCYLKGGDALTVHLDDDPASALEWYFEDGGSTVGGVKGNNWFIPCDASMMNTCEDIASVAEVHYLPNPDYLK